MVLKWFGKIKQSSGPTDEEIRANSQEKSEVASSVSENPIDDPSLERGVFRREGDKIIKAEGAGLRHLTEVELDRNRKIAEVQDQIEALQEREAVLNNIGKIFESENITSIREQLGALESQGVERIDVDGKDYQVAEILDFFDAVDDYLESLKILWQARGTRPKNQDIEAALDSRGIIDVKISGNNRSFRDAMVGYINDEIDSLKIELKL